MKLKLVTIFYHEVNVCINLFVSKWIKQRHKARSEVQNIVGTLSRIVKKVERINHTFKFQTRNKQ